MTMPRSARHASLMLFGLILVGLNLRPALTSVSPMLIEIGDSLGLGSLGQGILTTLPVLCLGLAAPLAPVGARRIGDEATILLALCVLALALLVRPWTGTAGLFMGTALAGGCIGVLGVLLPGLVKRDFPAQVGLMTGLYTMALCAGASVAAGATEPLRLAFAGEWRWALAFWLLPAIVAGVAWLPQLRRVHAPVKRRAVDRTRLRSSALAWQVTLFMGLQSSLAYSVFGWLPAILQDRGLNEVDAGLMLSLSIIIQVITAIVAPWIGGRCRDQRGVVIAVMLVTWAGLLSCLYAPIEYIALWAIVLGLGQGGSFSMALTLIALRAADSRTAADLSGMAQGVGYVLAALGPLLVGILHDFTEGWQSTGVLFSVIAIAALLMGFGAGRDREVGVLVD
jgi:CP family cyanate transporter-like MFS transporter